VSIVDDDRIVLQVSVYSYSSDMDNGRIIVVENKPCVHLHTVSLMTVVRGSRIPGVVPCGITPPVSISVVSRAPFH
jgi:hypothetical protein